jgi:hypothetical protein
MNLKGDELSALKDFVGRLLTYHKEYECEVLDDKDSEYRGRVQVAIPELRMDTLKNGIWASPEYSNNQATPIVGSYVLVHFLNGDISKPIYHGRSGRITANVPKAYKDPNTVVLFEDEGEEPLTVIYERKEAILKITKDNFSFQSDFKNKEIDEKIGDFQIHIKDDKILVKNSSKNLTTLLTTFIDTIKGMKTVGSPTSHTVSPDDIAKFTQLSEELKQLLGDS